MKKIVLSALLLPVLLSVQSCEDEVHSRDYNNETALDVSSLHFVETAAEAGHTEVRVSTMAKHISTNPRVVRFANMMINDHTAALNKLNKLKKSDMVQGHDPINLEHRKKIDSLSKLSGADFDKAYMKMMVNDHEEAVKLFESADEDRPADIQGYARGTLPTIKMHLDSAKKIYASLK